jgi:hypothetical protein
MELGGQMPSSGGGRRFRRFVSLVIGSALLVLAFLDAEAFKADAFGIRSEINATVYDFLPSFGFLVFLVYLTAYFIWNAFQWNNKVLGEITSDEPEIAATSMMISFRRYAKTKRHYQTGILISILAFYCSYLTVRHLNTTHLIVGPVELAFGGAILCMSYIVGRYFKPAEVFMKKFIRMFYQVPPTDPMSEEAINTHVDEKLVEIKRKHPSWFG